MRHFSLIVASVILSAFLATPAGAQPTGLDGVIEWNGAEISLASGEQNRELR